MKTRPALTLSDVNTLLDAAQNKAEENSWAVTIAVADSGGHLLALRRLDDAPLFSIDAATQKARTSAFGARETQLFEEMINNGRTAFLSAPMDSMLAGGVPVMVEGQMAGTVGVSGVKPDQDVEVARAAIAALG